MLLPLEKLRRASNNGDMRCASAVKRLIVTVLAIGFWVDIGLWVDTSAAQFIQTSPGVLQSTDGSAKIIVSYRSPGVFILLSNPIPVQRFDPSLLTEENASGAAHIFVRYDPTSDRYSAVTTGTTDYRVRGGLTIIAQQKNRKLRITIDNNNPYLSVVYESAGGTPEVHMVGFRGLQNIVKESGQDKVALVEANGFNQFKGMIAPYDLVEGKLQLKGEAIPTSAIGLELEPEKNICLRTGTAFLAKHEVDELRRTKDKEESARLLEKLLKKSSPGDQLRGVLLLRVRGSEIIALDYINSRVKIFHPLSTVARPVCVFDEVPLNS